MPSRVPPQISRPWQATEPLGSKVACHPLGVAALTLCDEGRQEIRSFVGFAPQFAGIGKSDGKIPWL